MNYEWIINQTLYAPTHMRLYTPSSRGEWSILVVQRLEIEHAKETSVHLLQNVIVKLMLQRSRRRVNLAKYYEGSQKS